VHVYGNVSWTDKPEITMSASGKDVYVSWNGPQGGDLYVGQSHDYGATWTQQKLSDDKRYYYAYDARVLAGGTVIFSESSIVYSGLKNVEGGSQIWHHAVISRDKGATWQNVVVAKVANGEACVAAGCGPDFYTGQTSVVSDASGHLVFAYEGATVDGGPQRVLHLPLLGRWANVDRRTARVRQRGERDRPAPRIVGWRQCAHVVHADVRG
jgi:hypothetical protein